MIVYIISFFILSLNNCKKKKKVHFYKYLMIVFSLSV